MFKGQIVASSSRVNDKGEVSFTNYAVIPAQGESKGTMAVEAWGKQGFTIGADVVVSLRIFKGQVQGFVFENEARDAA
jgi:hypothetical protein